MASSAAKTQQQMLAQVLAQKRAAAAAGGMRGVGALGALNRSGVGAKATTPLKSITGIEAPEGTTLQMFPWAEDVAFPSNFKLTKEEQNLLDAYALVRNCEREAARHREQEAKAKLAMADKEFHKKQEAAAAAAAAASKSREDDDYADEDKKDDDDNYTTMDMDDNDEGMKKKAAKPKRPTKAPKRKKPDANLSDNDDNDSEDEEIEDEDETGISAGAGGGGAGSFLDREYVREKMKKAKQTKKSQAEKEAEEAAAKEEEDRQRDALLGFGTDNNNDSISSGLVKKKAGSAAAGHSSLLSSAVSTATPIHEFSKKLGFDNNRDGRILFPLKSTKVDKNGVQSWSPPKDARRPTDRSLQMELPDFDSTLMTNKVGRPNNTLAIKFTAPKNSHRFSLNILGPDSDPKELTDVLVHFNPRRRERGGRLVVNDKQEGMWGKAVMIPLKEMPMQMFGPRNGCITLVIQINAEGFDFFIDSKHCARLDHRTPLPSGQCALHLQFPSTDDYGKPENWTVFRVWWGHKDTMAKDNHKELEAVAGFQKYNALHPRKLFISNLPKLQTSQELELRKAELERAFRKYGGNLGAIVLAPKDSAFAFVEVDDERQADMAIYEMQQSGRYRVIRARRTRYEALQEERAQKERAAAEAASEWD